MTREVIVRPEAEQDIREAYQWYGEISPVLSERDVNYAHVAALVLVLPIDLAVFIRAIFAFHWRRPGAAG